MGVQRKKWDILFSDIVRSIGHCEAQGYNDIQCSPQLQCAHIVTRKRSATRTDFRNAYCLCHNHHRFYTDFPREFSKFITTTWAQDTYEEIYEKSRIGTKVNWKTRTEELKDIQKKIKNGETTLAEIRKNAI